MSAIVPTITPTTMPATAAEDIPCPLPCATDVTVIVAGCVDEETIRDPVPAPRFALG